MLQDAPRIIAEQLGKRDNGSVRGGTVHFEFSDELRRVEA
jgi:hypothetical protein